MKILWMSWKDSHHPDAGGAEVVKDELCKRLILDGHQIIQLVSGFPNCDPTLNTDGGQIIRIGSRFTVYWRVYRHYKKHLKNWPDIVIDECNTVPFFSSFYVKNPSVMMVHQLAREIWFYQMPKPIAIIGFLIEPIYLWLLRKNNVITVSSSSKRDLLRYGFQENKINIISEGIAITPANNLDELSKFSDPTLLYLGSIREMKRPIDIIFAFHLAKLKIKNLKLIIAGSGGGPYFKKFISLLNRNPKDIQYLGRVNEKQKLDLLKKSSLIVATSVKEGWGLIITEAASQGTPAVAYDVDGLRDSIKDQMTGLLTIPKIEALANGIVMILSNHELYNKCRIQGWKWSKEINFDNSYHQFIEILKKVIDKNR
jgi:glycosyltransferase involved in cell wall biosynthesis